MPARKYPSLQESVKAALAGEDEAWAWLYSQHSGGIYNIALQICGNTADAREAVQDTFVSAYLKLAQLRAPDSFGAWLRNIALHHCYRSLRKNSRIEFSAQLPEKCEYLLEEELQNKIDGLFLQSNLYSLLSSLPEKLLVALLLRYFTRFQSYAEIAAILSLPIGTVRSRLNQAKLKLTENWTQRKGFGMDKKELQEWNDFYHEVFSGMHGQDAPKNQFINHLHKDMQIIFTSGRIDRGSQVIDAMIAEDRISGNWFKPSDVQSCGNISIVEARHFNLPGFPKLCPESTVCVLYRKNGKVARMNLYASPQ